MSDSDALDSSDSQPEVNKRSRKYSSDSSQPDIKRQRRATVSGTSQSSAQHDSDDENDATNFNYNNSTIPRRAFTYQEGSTEIKQLSSSSDSSDAEESTEKNDVQQYVDPTFTKNYSSPAVRMMSNMGYKFGKGLGKHEMGLTEPIKASTQKGLRGLGAAPSAVGELPSDFEWNPDESKPTADEIVEWLPEAPNDELTADILEVWLQKGEKKLYLDDESEFVKESVLRGVLSAKNVFDTLDAEDMRKARFRSNPYETIGSVIFLNRAAVKMANMDAICDYMFTNPVDQRGHSVLRSDDLLYFADVCAGPGGFSEYVLYRKKWKAKGFGFTLRGKNDFKLSEFYVGPPDTFSPYYGPNDDGDIFNPANLSALTKHVLDQTYDTGVHFLMADGGFSVDGQENIQEILSKQLYLCQCLAALLLVRTGGHFVMKLFDIFTPFSVSLVYLMYRCFHRVSIHKPVTSRPANSERYLICKWKRAGVDAVREHLFNVNAYLWEQKNTNQDGDITSLVPLEVIKADSHFYQYIFKSNCILGEKQIKSLLKIKQFSENENLTELTQDEMRTKCLQHWKLPDEVRTQPHRLTHDSALQEIISLMEARPRNAGNPQAFKEYLNAPPTVAKDINQIKQKIMFVHDWHFQFLSSCKENNECSYLLGTGNAVYQLKNHYWEEPREFIKLKLPAKTLIYVEISKEFIDEGAKQRFTRAVHVIDGVCLGGIDISHKTLSERHQECEIFCRALSKPFDPNLTQLRCKRMFSLKSFQDSMEYLRTRKMKNGPCAVAIDIQNRAEPERKFHVVSTVLFLKEIKLPWGSKMSKSQGNIYYFKTLRDFKCTQGQNDLPREGVMDALSCVNERIEWYWEPAMEVFMRGGHSGLQRQHVEEFVLRQLSK